MAKSESEKTRMLGEFRILRRLGQGGMAEVFLAEQTSLQRNVAVKVLRPSLLKDVTYLQRFKTEAMAAAGLNHPNIVQVYMVGESDGIHYIAQEYVDGKNLREFLARKGPPELPLALHIMRQVAAALNAAGAAGIVHRDIKPENIMITRKGEVKVADFGLAKLGQPGKPVSLTQTGITMGTPLYMSPEQVSGAQLDPRSDIYSFGVTCYHMLAGVPPFRGETALSVAVQHIRGEAEPLEKLRIDLPPALCQLVHKMMAKEISERYDSAAAVLKDLKRLSQDRKDAEVDVTGVKTPVAGGEGLVGIARRSSAKIQRFIDRPIREQILPFLWTALIVTVLFGSLGWLLRPSNPLKQPPGSGNSGAVTSSP